MIIPARNEILSPSGEYDTIPICREVCTDVVTSATLLRRIAERNNRFYLLESIEGGEEWGRYSSLGYNSVMRVICRCGKVKIKSHVSRSPSREVQTDHPMDILCETLVQYKSPRPRGRSPFIGGFVGYFAYAMIEYAESALHINGGGANDLGLILFGRVIAYDHLRRKVQIVASMKTGRTERGIYEGLGRCRGRKRCEDRENGNTSGGLEYLMKKYKRARGEAQEMASLVSDTAPLKRLSSPEKPSFVCSVSKEEFCGTVEKTEEYILDGDTFRAVISRQFTSSYGGSLLNAYRVSRITNPSSYVVYMNIDQDEIISTLPETLAHPENGRLTIFPAAGSRPRGAEDEEDRKLEEELPADRKELSERNMLMNLGRNDIGHIAEFGSVEVMEYKMMRKYFKIMHICSQVEGNIKPDLDSCSAMEALLPAGILSGVPKIRAREITEKLGSVPRGIYGGVLGYLGFTGNLDTCIAIRTAVKQAEKVMVRTGGGIVADSVPEPEYGEPVNKAKTVVQTILQAEEVSGR